MFFSDLRTGISSSSTTCTSFLGVQNCRNSSPAKKGNNEYFFVVRDKARTKTKKMIDHIFFTGVFVRQLTMKLPRVSGKTNIMKNAGYLFGSFPRTGKTTVKNDQKLPVNNGHYYYGRL
jgi:hypothetical protein